MLKTLQKALGLSVDAEKPVDEQALALAAAVEAAVAPLQAEFAEFKTSAEALMATAAEKITSLTAELAAANELLAAADAAKVEAEAAGLAVKLAARKEKVVASIGTERADALLKVTEGMDDAAFEAVVSALGASAAVEAAAPLFKEVGVEAQADATQVVETAEMKTLRAKYQSGKK